MCAISTDPSYVSKILLGSGGDCIQIEPVAAILNSQSEFLSVPQLVDSVISQVDGAGWGFQNTKLKGPCGSSSPQCSKPDERQVYLNPLLES